MLVKHKSHLCAHGSTKKCRVNYWETYSQVVNWVSIRAIITQIILRELHTKSVGFVLAYTQAEVTSEIFMGIPIIFGVERFHPREWVI